MGRFKNIEIQGLLLEDFGKIFIEALNNSINTSNLSREEAIKKVAPKFEKLLAEYEESISTLYLEKHKFDFPLIIGQLTGHRVPSRHCHTASDGITRTSKAMVSNHPTNLRLLSERLSINYLSFPAKGIVPDLSILSDLSHSFHDRKE